MVDERRFEPESSCAIERSCRVSMVFSNINKLVALFLPVLCWLGKFSIVRAPVLWNSWIIFRKSYNVIRMIDANCVLAIFPHFKIRFLENEDLILLQDALSRAHIFRLLEVQCERISGALFIFNYILVGCKHMSEVRYNVYRAIIAVIRIGEQRHLSNKYDPR